MVDIMRGVADLTFKSLSQPEYILQPEYIVLPSGKKRPVSPSRVKSQSPSISNIQYVESNGDHRLSKVATGVAGLPNKVLFCGVLRKNYPHQLLKS